METLKTLLIISTIALVVAVVVITLLLVLYIREIKKSTAVKLLFDTLLNDMDPFEEFTDKTVKTRKEQRHD